MNLSTVEKQDIYLTMGDKRYKLCGTFIKSVSFTESSVNEHMNTLDMSISYDYFSTDDVETDPKKEPVVTLHFDEKLFEI